MEDTGRISNIVYLSTLTFLLSQCYNADIVHQNYDGFDDVPVASNMDTKFVQFIGLSFRIGRPYLVMSLNLKLLQKVDFMHFKRDVCILGEMCTFYCISTCISAEMQETLHFNAFQLRY